MKYTTTISPSAVDSFISRNSHIDFHTHDFLRHGNASIEWHDISNDEHLTDLMHYQKVMRLGANSQVAQHFIEQGLHSANHIASLPVKHFIKQYNTENSNNLNLADEPELKKIHAKASNVASKVRHLWASVRGSVASPLLRNSKFNSMGSETAEVFENLPSYQELFGGLDYCSCSECRSIMGAAAYLNDLNRIIDVNINDDTDNKIPSGLRFADRRPDIGNIPLTCDATNTLIPYIQIINERLGKYATTSLELPSYAALIEYLATKAVFPMNLPFNAAFDEISTLLLQVGSSYGTIAKSWQLDANTALVRDLGISFDTSNILTKIETNESKLYSYFGIPLASKSTLVNPEIFNQQTGLDFASLGQLINQDLTSEELVAKLNVNFFINSLVTTKGSFVQLVQSEPGKPWELGNLAEALDPINRLIRLSHQINVNTIELDWMLRAIGQGKTPVINEEAMANIAYIIKELTDEYNLDCYSACSLLGPIKTYGQGSNEQSQFDNLFNSKALVTKYGKYQPAENPLNSLYTSDWLLWTPGSDDKASLEAISRLLPGLGVDLADANRLGIKVFGSKEVSLTVENISTLVRHSILAKMLQLPIEQYLMLLTLAKIDGSKPFTCPSLRSLLDTSKQIKASGVNLYTLDYFINGNISTYVALPYQPKTVSDWLNSLLATVTVKPSDAGNDIISQVANFFGQPIDKIQPLMTMAVKAVELPSGVKTWQDGFLDRTSEAKPKYPDYVSKVLDMAARYLVLKNSLQLADETIVNILNNPNTYLLDDNCNGASVKVFLKIYSIHNFLHSFGDAQFDLLNYISLSTAGESTKELVIALNKATNWDINQASFILDNPLKEVSNPITRLFYLDGIFTIIAKTNSTPAILADAAALINLTALDNWDQYQLTAKNMLASVQSRYGDNWPSIATTFIGTLNLHTRDALRGLVLTELRAKYADITTSQNMSEFFLMNVDMGADTAISYVKEALNASQLYLQRCRLKLEQGVVETNISDNMWDWLLNYRIWEANRQIYLYPENYLIPALRKTTTPEFAKLANDLKQSEINDAYVDETFSDYMESFNTMAKLKPVTSYRTVVEDSKSGPANTLFVFAKADTDPNTFYYAYQSEGSDWTVWQKIDVSITANKITPVYAFGKLMIFWVEITQEKSSAIENSNSTSNLACKVNIKYSFQNSQKRWSATQTLISDEVIIYDTNGSSKVTISENPIFSGILDVHNSAWNNLAIITTKDSNYPVRPDVSSTDKLCIMYGPVLVTAPKGIQDGSEEAPSANNSLAFYEELHQAMSGYNQTIANQNTGNQLLRKAIVLDEMLDTGALIHHDEYLLLDEYQASTPSNLIKAGFSVNSASLAVASSGTMITDNLVGKNNSSSLIQSGNLSISSSSFITRSIDTKDGNSNPTDIFNKLKDSGVIKTDEGGNNTVDANALQSADLATILAPLVQTYNSGPTGISGMQLLDVQKVLYSYIPASDLLTKVDIRNSKVAPVLNQPSWFTLETDGESFLFSPAFTKEDPDKSTSMLDASTTVDVPRLCIPSFIFCYKDGDNVVATNADVANKIWSALTSENKIITNGRLNPGIGLSEVQAALQALIDDGTINKNNQVPIIFNILNNSPIIYDSAFVNDSLNISLEASQQIYIALRAYSVIDISGRIAKYLVTPNNINAALGDVINRSLITAGQTPDIYETLITATAATSLKYANKNANAYTSPADYIFKVTRLSTNADTKLNKALFVGSAAKLLDINMQNYPVIAKKPFARFGMTDKVQPPAALDGTQVDFNGLYGQYFWEIFYHIPRLISYMQEGNNDYQSAIKWLQYIFDPTNTEQFVTAKVIVNQSEQSITQDLAEKVVTTLQENNIGDSPILSAEGRVNPEFSTTTSLSCLAFITTAQITMVQAILLNYKLESSISHHWQFFPFRNHKLETITQNLSDNSPAMKIYNNDPFNPFAIARLRIGAFEKAVVMQYINALIQWADMMFRMDTWESINAATLLYIYANDLLGPKPVEVGECPDPSAGTVVNYNFIKKAYADAKKAVPQFLIDLEVLIPDSNSPQNPVIAHAFNDLNVYFCVPENEQLLSYWDIVSDRMYKVENSLNIDGVYRVLPLFQPPLNPLDLIKAANAGNNVQSVLPQGSNEAIIYRFSTQVVFARQLAEAVSGFGQKLLTALEQKDAQGMSMLMNNQSDEILKLTKSIKQDRIDELKSGMEALQHNLAQANYRVSYYDGLISQNLIPSEQTSLDAMTASMLFTVASNILSAAATISYTIPQVGSPFAITYGGIQVGSAATSAATVMEIGANISNYISNRASTMAGFSRRKDEWSHQKSLADYDTKQLNSQISSMDKQQSQAEQEFALAKQQINDNQSLKEYLQSKFTNEELYSWLVSRLSSIYYQAYQTALDVAKNVQACYQLERNNTETFLNFNYWDNLHKGLLAGDELVNAINNMEVKYRKTASRSLEITKTVSLAQLDPNAFMKLRDSGECDFSLTEELFDYDYPGHYARQIKTISVTIPAIIGPTQNINATLTQQKNTVVTANSIDAVKFLLGLTTEPPKTGIRTDWLKSQSIALSQGVDDHGMFQLNFNDDRYLPFEGTGAVSEWHLSMPKETNRFNFDSISDVLITIKYTASQDLGSFATSVKQALAQKPLSGGLFIDLANNRANTWQGFLANHTDPKKQTLTMDIDPGLLNYLGKVEITKVLLKLDTKEVKIDNDADFLSLVANKEPAATFKFTDNMASIGEQWQASDALGPWNYSFDLTNEHLKPLLTDGFIDGSKLVNMQMIILYQGKIF